jgi:hypothetical protein
VEVTCDPSNPQDCPTPSLFPYGVFPCGVPRGLSPRSPWPYKPVPSSSGPRGLSPRSLLPSKWGVGQSRGFRGSQDSGWRPRPGGPADGAPASARFPWEYSLTLGISGTVPPPLCFPAGSRFPAGLKSILSGPFPRDPPGEIPRLHSGPPGGSPPPVNPPEPNLPFTFYLLLLALTEARKVKGKR